MTDADFIEKFERERIRHSHRHPPVININKIHAKKLTTGERIADKLAAVMGSWPFIIVQSVLLAIWIALNVAAYIHHWDPYPFILLNLALSFQAAYAAPVIMMSQNRQAAKDRLMAEQDYEVNLKGRGRVEIDHDASRAAGRSDARHAPPDGGAASGDPGQARAASGRRQQQHGARVKKKRAGHHDA